MKKSAQGFTLIELLVVISITAVIGIYAIANFRSFGADQNTKSSALEIQSFLRLAQSNSTSNLKCQSQPTTNWFIVFTSNTSLDLKCQNSVGTSSSLKSLSMPENITYTVANASGDCTPNQVNFAPLTGAMTTSNCSSGSIIINLANSKGGSKQVRVEQGGRIYVPFQ